MHRKAVDSDIFFVLIRGPDPFKSNPFVKALMALELVDRKRIVQQVVLVCAVCEGLEPLDALELLAKMGQWIGKTEKIQCIKDTKSRERLQKVTETKEINRITIV